MNFVDVIACDKQDSLTNVYKHNSSLTTQLFAPLSSRATIDDRAFLEAAASIWNIYSLPARIGVVASLRLQ